jgi:multicomponent Na+:H+ antiporter subunit C
MINYFMGYYGYWFVAILMVIGLYGMMVKKNMVKKIIGLSIFQTGIIFFFIVSANKFGATVPIMMRGLDVTDTANYINPLPHTLMLTAIVVGVATTGVAFALIITIYKRYKTLEEDELLKRMKDDE